MGQNGPGRSKVLHLAVDRILFIYLSYKDPDIKEFPSICINAATKGKWGGHRPHRSRGMVSQWGQESPQQHICYCSSLNVLGSLQDPNSSCACCCTFCSCQVRSSAEVQRIWTHWSEEQELSCCWANTVQRGVWERRWETGRHSTRLIKSLAAHSETWSNSWV